MNKWLEIFGGLALVIATLVLSFYSQNGGAFNFWNAAGEFLKGGIFWMTIMIGTILIILGISNLKEE